MGVFSGIAQSSKPTRVAQLTFIVSIHLHKVYHISNIMLARCILEKLYLKFLTFTPR